MRKIFISIVMGAAIMMVNSGAKAQVDLSTYADPEGFLDIQALTCAQLAGTWQDQADLLSSWYSGGDSGRYPTRALTASGSSNTSKPQTTAEPSVIGR